MLRVPNIRAVTGRPRLRLALLAFAALVSVVALAVVAQAEILPSGDPATVADLSGAIRTHSNADYAGAKSPPFSIPCDGCHVTHKADNMNLLQAEGVAICGRCHDLTMIHRDPATQQSVQSVSAAAVPGDCLTCHPHSSGFMPATGAVSLTVSAQAMGYDDLDEDGILGPGDRVHYRIDYGNRGPEEVTGVLLHSELDKAHVASVEEITDDGRFDEAAFAIQWDIGTLASGTNGFVTYAAVLEDAPAFGDDSAAPSGTGPAEPGDEESTVDDLTTTTRTSEGHLKTSKGHVKTVDESGPETVEISATGSSIADPATEAPSESSTSDTSTEDSGTETSVEGPTTTTTTAIDGSTPTTIATATAAAGPNDVVTRVVLTADDRDPVYATVVVSLGNDGLDSTTSTSINRGWDTTTTSRSTTSTTLVVGPDEVLNTAVLTADTWEPISTSAVISVVVPPPPEPEPQESPVTEGETTVSDPSAVPLGEAAIGHGDRDEGGHQSTGGRLYREIDHGRRGSEDYTLSKRAVGYDDLDADGNLSPGDRVHYLIYFRNPGLEEVTGVVLVDELDKTRVAAVEGISGGGTFDPTTFEITWDIGTLKALASGFVMYEVVLQGSGAFGGEPARPTGAGPAKTEDQGSTDSLTTTTGTTEGQGTDSSPEDSTTETSSDPPASDTPTTAAAPSGEPGSDTTGVPLAALAVLPLAGVAIRRFSPRTKARRRSTTPPKRHS